MSDEDWRYTCPICGIFYVIIPEGSDIQVIYECDKLYFDHLLKCALCSGTSVDCG